MLEFCRYVQWSFHYKRRKRHANICSVRLFQKKIHLEIIPNSLALIIVTNSFWNHSDMTAFVKHGDCQVCSVFLVYCWFHWVMVTIQFTKNAHLSCIQERGKHKLASLLKRNAASHMKKCPSTPAPKPTASQ